MQGLALVTTLLAYAQIVLGAQLRHVTGGSGRRRVSHGRHRFICWWPLLLLVHIVWLAIRVARTRGEPWLLRPALALPLLVMLQLALGAGTWVLNYGWPAWAADWPSTAGFVVVHESQRQALVTTAHVATGSLILVTSLLVFACGPGGWKARRLPTAVELHAAWRCRMSTSTLVCDRRAQPNRRCAWPITWS